MASVAIKTGGKAEYVRTEAGAICQCKHNVDFSIGNNCIMQVHGSVLREVMENNGQYAPGMIHIHRRKVGVDHRCLDCYARRHNWGPVTPKEVNNVTRATFEERKPAVVRLGKDSEALHPYYLPALMSFANLCIEYGTRIIAPTKALPFGKNSFRRFPHKLGDFLKSYTPTSDELVHVLQATHAAINYSIGNDKAESGAASQGFTNSWRIQQALLYREAGVNASLTLNYDVTSSFKDNASRGFAVLQALEACDKNNIPFKDFIRILPRRLNSRRNAVALTGATWQELQQPWMFHGVAPPRYQTRARTKANGARTGNNELVPMLFHPDTQELVKHGVGVCGQVGETEHCDHCRIFNKRTRLVVPLSELVSVAYSDGFYADRKRLREKRKKTRTGKKPGTKPTHKQTTFI